MDYTVHGPLQVRILEWVAFISSRHLPNPGREPRSPSLQADSLPAEPPGMLSFQKEVVIMVGSQIKVRFGCLMIVRDEKRERHFG